jgi:hypothetical protein
MKITSISWSYERTVNLGNYSSAKVRAEYSANTDDHEKDMKKLKKLCKKEVDKEAERLVEELGSE